jgi:hypothetical protein
MDSGRNTRALPRVGFPIRRSPDQRSVSTSPGLIAAAHVLLRLLAPRHPPCALVLLIEENPCVVAMEFSRCARDGARRKTTPLRGRSLKTQQRLVWPSGARIHPGSGVPYTEVDVVLGELAHRTTREGPSTGRAPTGVMAPASLERR